MVARDTNTLTISELTAGTPYTFMLTFATEYSDGKSGDSSDRTIDITTQSNLVTAVVDSNTDTTTITLSWADPEDRVRYSGVMVTGGTMAGVMITPQTVSASDGSTAQQVAIMGLTADTDYTFILATQYADDDAGNSKTGDSVEVPTRTRNPIDTNGDGLVDINSLERLDNVRYNLDLGDASDDGRYKESTQTAVNAGTQCGAAAATPCTGYELTRSLNFADGGSYDSGVVNTEWRPNASDPDNATNAGWDPIGDCNTATTGNANSCGDNNDTPFAARFEGNGFTIHNLYARNITANNGSAIGLFGITAATATIRSLGVQDVALYGGRAGDRVGGIVGRHGGTIVGSYASDGSANGANKQNGAIGGLVGRSNGTIIASYAAVAVGSTSSFTNNAVGGLVGIAASGSTVIVSYASGTVDGSSGNSENVGGLVGNYENDDIIASYASGDVNGGNGSALDFVGGLTGSGVGNITASYATGAVDGGNSASFAGTLRGGGGAPTTNFSYGFGTVTNNGSGGYAGTAKPTVDGTAITSATQLTAANVPAIWNSAADITFNAWDFGDDTEPPALRYADYDGTDTDYGCIDASNPTSTGTIVIPAVVASPSGPLDVICGVTPLPGQGRP